MSDATARLGLPVLPPTPLQPHVTHNEALVQLDALLFARLKDRDLSAPPASPADGDAYLVKAPATGAWTGQDGRIAYALDGGWRFCAPFAGLSAYVADEHKLIFHDGSSWGEFAAVVPLQNLPLLGINTSADSTNRLAVKSAALLLDNAGAGMQAKVNKHASSDTASLLYQTGYSGRAEMGLAGDDDFHIKTSPDGATWREAVVLKATNGRIGLNTASPAAPLELHVDGSVVDASLIASDDFILAKESGASAFAGIIASNASAARMVFKGSRARGTLAAPNAVAAGDWTFSLLGVGYDGATTRGTAGITFAVDGAVSAGTVPQRIVFETRAHAVGGELALELPDQAALAVLHDLEQVVGLQGIADHAHRQATDELGFEAIVDEVLGARLAHE